MKRISPGPVNYPLGTIAAYGPDNKLATKLVVAVFKRPGKKDPDDLHRWLTNAGDVRNDPTIGAEVAGFLKRHRVQQTTAYDRIIGCPHEEGVDYPLGGTCPHCPFWRGIDRFTHEPKAPVTPSLTPERVLAELSVERGTQPLEALAAADAQREALVEPLLQAVERGVANPRGMRDGEMMLFSYATYLLAKWREQRAYPLIIRWLSLPGEAAFELGGDTVTEHGGRFLAMTCGGNQEPIHALIINRDANEYCRGQAVEALALLAAWGEVPREDVVDYFLRLAREGLEREVSHVWDNLAWTCADIEALPVFPELRRAYDDGLIDPGFISAAELDQVEAAPRGSEIERFLKWHPPITDVAEAMSWWGCFDRHPLSTAERLAEVARQLAAVKPGAAPKPPRVAPKVGRNDPCPCGSGKKYKKCCGR